MRIFGTIVVLAALGGIFLWQRNGERSEAGNAVSTALTRSATSSPAPAATARPSGEASEHNWMKRSLDRARDVRDQSRARTRDSQDP